MSGQQGIIRLHKQLTHCETARERKGIYMTYSYTQHGVLKEFLPGKTEYTQFMFWVYNFYNALVCKLGILLGKTAYIQFMFLVYNFYNALLCKGVLLSWENCTRTVHVLGVQLI